MQINLDEAWANIDVLPPKIAQKLAHLRLNAIGMIEMIGKVAGKKIEVTNDNNEGCSHPTNRQTSITRR